MSALLHVPRPRRVVPVPFVVGRLLDRPVQRAVEHKRAPVPWKVSVRQARDEFRVRDDDYVAKHLADPGEVVGGCRTFSVKDGPVRPVALLLRVP